MKVVYKYALCSALTSVPYGIVRAVDFQRDQLFAWIEHSPDEMRRMVLKVAGTGELIEPPYDFQGTAVSDALVWHVFKLKS